MVRLVFLCLFLLSLAEVSAETEGTEDEYVQTSTIRIPTVYASMGTPLYEVLGVFEKYAHLEGMAALIRHYGIFMTPIFRHGLALSCQEKVTPSERSAYLKELRALEEEKRRIMFHLMNLTVKAADEDDYETFEKLVSLPLDELFTIASKRHIALTYYKSHRRRPIAAMDALAAEAEKERRTHKNRARTQTAAESGGRTYELKQHLPSQRASGVTGGEETASGAYCDDTDPSALKKIGKMFQSMGIDFDPSLLEDYKSHKPPSADDIK